MKSFYTACNNFENESMNTLSYFLVFTAYCMTSNASIVLFENVTSEQQERSDMEHRHTVWIMLSFKLAHFAKEAYMTITSANENDDNNTQIYMSAEEVPMHSVVMKTPVLIELFILRTSRRFMFHDVGFLAQFSLHNETVRPIFDETTVSVFNCYFNPKNDSKNLCA